MKQICFPVYTVSAAGAGGGVMLIMGTEPSGDSGPFLGVGMQA